MSILKLPHARPATILFDWHATLVDTRDAMYRAVDDVLPKLVELGLIERLVPAENSRTTDVIAAKEANVTAIFYNGAGWDQTWIDKIFPGTVRHPHKPDAVINHFSELASLVEQFLQMAKGMVVSK